jgi:transposase
VNSPGSKKKGVPPAPTFVADAERKEAERSAANGSAASATNVASPAPAKPTPNPEVVADARRRSFTLEYKMRILTQADAAKEQPGAVGALLRREGLYSSHLTTWRKEREAGVRRALTPKTRGPKPKLDPQQEELRKLRRENEQLTEALRKAELIIDVQKNYRARPIRTPAGPETPMQVPWCVGRNGRPLFGVL